MSKHIAPTLNLKSFHCPFCQVLTEQTWAIHLTARHKIKYPNGQENHSDYRLGGYLSAKCSHCGQISVWFADKMIYPLTGNVEPANPDLPADVLDDYNEAKDIVNISPRGSAALLRLALQKLMVHIDEKGKVLNDDISNLVKRGLPIQLQQALDSIRVIGNHAVHPGQIDLDDKPDTAFALFSFVNIICDYFITQPKKIAEVFGNLPDKDKENIAKRDS